MLKLSLAPIECKAAGVLAQNAGCVAAILGAAALIWLAREAVFWCYSLWGTCGTPCAMALFELWIAPVILVLPFARLLTAKSLSRFGLAARCAVTCGLGVWIVAMALVQTKSYLF